MSSRLSRSKHTLRARKKLKAHALQAAHITRLVPTQPCMHIHDTMSGSPYKYQPPLLFRHRTVQAAQQPIQKLDSEHVPTSAITAWYLVLVR